MPVYMPFSYVVFMLLLLGFEFGALMYLDRQDAEQFKHPENV